MKTLVLRSADNSTRVEYKVDLIGNSENITVMEIVGLDTAEIVAGLDFRLLDTHVKNFIDFATASSLILDKVDIDPAVGTVNLYTP